MPSRLFFLVPVIALWSSLSVADLYRAKYNAPKGPDLNLIQEHNSIRLQSEPTVQILNPPSSMFLSVLAGLAQPNYLNVESHDRTVNYGFSQPIPLLTAQFTDYLWTHNGKWGWSASLGYSYSEYESLNSTALHFLPVELNFAYRMETKSTQKIVPYFMAGPALWTYFQRGLDQYNTSQSILLGSVTAGASLNLNRMGWINSRNDTEILLQYQRNVGASGGSADLSGNVFQIGGTLAL